MPSKIALVDFNKCDPKACSPDGICPAAKACLKKLMKQEKPGEPPMTDPFSCRACADCVRACPKKAIRIVTQ